MDMTAHSSTESATAERAFLGEHRWAVLSTGRRDGSPQTSMVAYTCDGEDLLLATRRSSAKYRNISRVPKVAMFIPDGERGVSLYGEADLLEHDPTRTEAMKTIMRSFGATPPDDDVVAAGLDSSDRVVVRIRPDVLRMHSGPAAG